MSRRMAPYARHVLAAMRAGRHPNVYLFAGPDAWNQAGHRRRQQGDESALVLPPGDDPATYRWPALDAVCLVADLPGDVLRSVVLAMLADGVRLVVEIHTSRAPVFHYRDSDSVLGVAA